MDKLSRNNYLNDTNTTKYKKGKILAISDYILTTEMKYKLIFSFNSSIPQLK